MTREEAKNFLIDIFYKLGNMAIEYLTEKDGEKMREAIKALEEEPCKDAISRQAVKELYYKDGYISFRKICELPPVNPQEPSRDMEEIAEVINCDADAETKCKMISSIVNGKPHYFTEQEPKTGHWILQPSNKEQGERDFIWWKCSNCGQVIYSETEKDRREYHAFCGRCGEKMFEPQERNDKE